MGSAVWFEIPTHYGISSLVLKITMHCGFWQSCAITVGSAMAGQEIVLGIQRDCLLPSKPIVYKQRSPSKFLGSVNHFYALRLWRQVWKSVIFVNWKVIVPIWISPGIYWNVLLFHDHCLKKSAQKQSWLAVECELACTLVPGGAEGRRGAVKNTGGRKGMSLVSWVWVWWVGQWGRGRVSTQEEGRAAYKAISVSACREDPHQVKTFPPASTPPPPPPPHRKKQDLWGIKELVDLFLFANEASGQYGRQNSRRVVERFRPANTHSIIFRVCEKLHLT